MNKNRQIKQHNSNYKVALLEWQTLENQRRRLMFRKGGIHPMQRRSIDLQQKKLQSSMNRSQSAASRARIELQQLKAPKARRAPAFKAGFGRGLGRVRASFGSFARRARGR